MSEKDTNICTLQISGRVNFNHKKDKVNQTLFVKIKDLPIWGTELKYDKPCHLGEYV